MYVGMCKVTETAKQGSTAILRYPAGAGAPLNE